MEGVYEMNRILFLCVVVMGVSFSSILKAEIVLYCQSELSTGFFKDGQSWRPSDFKNKRHTIKFNNDYSKLYGLDDNRHYLCSPAYQTSPNTLVCLSGYSNGETFIFNKKTKRFVFSSPKATTGYDSDGPDTDTISIGNCKKF